MRSPATPCLQVVKGSHDLLLEFWDPSISREPVKVETSNLARMYTTRGTNKNAKLSKKVSGRVT